MATSKASTSHDKVENLNFDIRFFLENLKKYREEANYIDKTLIKSLNSVVETIDEFLSSDPEELPSQEKTIIDCNLTDNGIKMKLFCTLCKEHIGRTAGSVQRHLGSPDHVANFVQLQQRLNGEVTTEKKTLQLANEEMPAENNGSKQNLPKKIRKFIDENSFTFIDESIKVSNGLKDVALYNDIRDCILQSIQPIYPDVKISFYGSRIYGLGSPQSDLEVFVDIGDFHNLFNEPKTAIKKKLEEVRDRLKSNYDEWKDFEWVKDIRTPKLRCFHNKSRIRCHLTFSNGHTDRQTQFLKHIFTIFPHAQKLYVYVRRWFAIVGLNLRAIGNYAQFLMVIFYLQTKRLLPPIKDIPTDLEPLPLECKEFFERNFTNLLAWQGNFLPKQLKNSKLKPVEDNLPTFMKHLIGFFEYYGKTFDFQGHIVCPLLGKAMPKLFFKKHHNFNGNRKEILSQNKSDMFVQDPIELNNNVCNAVPPGVLNYMIHYCNMTANRLIIVTENVDEEKI